MQILRTSDSCFADLTDYPFAPQYTDITTHDGSELRIHHIDEGPKDGPVVLCIHGQLPVYAQHHRTVFRSLVDVVNPEFRTIVCGYVGVLGCKRVVC